ncbi:MAG: fumarylacetoacetate hydrolase family protein [Candidatus Eremiobacteraeota bacterium]|nr:fumarylacetoacetate hydrolase family protein [Candidatus Eremiobacteraeota bacterium]
MQTAVELFAEALYAAERDRRPIAPLTTQSGFDVECAYRTQQALLARKLRDGARVVGYKIGLTAKAMRDQLGIAEPDYGFLLDSMLVDSGSTIVLADFIAPKIEPEIAFYLSKDLTGPSVTAADVIRNTDSLVAAFEIIDSRIADWKIALGDTIADNASSARVVLASRRVPVDKVDLTNIAVDVRVDGDLVSRGRSADVLGNPAAAVAWLATRLASYGVPLLAGQVIMPGAMTAAIALRVGSHYAASFEGIGDVTVGFR